MQGELYAVYQLNIDPAGFEAFETLAAKIVEDSRSEPDTLVFSAEACARCFAQKPAAAILR